MGGKCNIDRFDGQMLVYDGRNFVFVFGEKLELEVVVIGSVYIDAKEEETVPAELVECVECEEVGGLFEGAVVCLQLVHVYVEGN